MKIQLKSEEHLSIKQPGSTDVNAIDIYTSGNTGNVAINGQIEITGGLMVSGRTVLGIGVPELVNITPSAAITIDPYKMNNLGTLSGITTILFNTSAEISGYCAMYSMMFVAGQSCSVVLPNTVKYNGGIVPVYVADRTYEININNGLVVIGEFY